MRNRVRGEEFLRVEQRPEKVVEHPFRFGVVRSKVSFEFHKFVRGWPAAQAAQVKVLDNLIGRFAVHLVDSQDATKTLDITDGAFSATRR